MKEQLLKKYCIHLLTPLILLIMKQAVTTIETAHQIKGRGGGRVGKQNKLEGNKH